MRIPLAGEHTDPSTHRADPREPSGHPRARSLRRTGPGRRRSTTLDTAVTIPRTPAGRARSRADVRRRRSPAPAGAARLPVESRPRRLSWRALARRVPVFLLVVAVLAALIHAFTDARFYVYKGHIIGARHLEAAIIYQAAGVHEQSIFWVDPNAVAARVAQVDGVKAVQVRCELPARVTITVEERQPTILWRAVSQGRDWWLDEQGVVLPYHGDPASPDVIFVVDYSARALAIGQRVAPADLVPSVLSLTAAMPDVRLYTYDDERGLGFTQEQADAHWPVYLGGSQDLARKIQIMQAMTAYLASNQVRPRYVDVRWADHPVYGRPEGVPAAGTPEPPSGSEE